MNQTKNYSSIRAVKNTLHNTVLIYKAVHIEDNSFELSIDEYRNDFLAHTSTQIASFESIADLEILMQDMCKVALEPCHLKDIIEDL